MVFLLGMMVGALLMVAILAILRQNGEDRNE